MAIVASLVVEREVSMEKQVGEVTHYFNRIGVAVLDLNDSLNIGDMIHFSGHTTDFTQRITSMEINHRKVQSVGPGAEVAVKVEDRVRRGDTVFKVLEKSGVEASFGATVA